MDDFDSLVPTPLVEVPDLPESGALKRPCLVVLAGPDTGRVIVLTDLAPGGALLVGRRGHAEVFLDDLTVSRHHCRLAMDDLGQVSIEDLDSRNRTLRNNEPLVGATVLRDGDRVQLGESAILKFSLQDGLEVGFQSQLYEAAMRDSLTQLLCRRFLLERCEQAFAKARAERVPLAFLMFDLDHLKRVNDEHGHPVGDEALAHVARLLLQPTRPTDLCGRYGGDEFAVVCPGTDLLDALGLADRIREQVACTPLHWNEQTLTLSVSAGVAAVPDPTIVQPHQLVRYADEALYRAKRAGRNQTRVYFDGHEED